MKKVAVIASVILAGFTIYWITRPRKPEPEDFAAETKPIIVTNP